MLIWQRGRNRSEAQNLQAASKLTRKADPDPKHSISAVKRSQAWFGIPSGEAWSKRSPLAASCGAEGQPALVCLSRPRCLTRRQTKKETEPTTSGDRPEDLVYEFSHLANSFCLGSLCVESCRARAPHPFLRLMWQDKNTQQRAQKGGRS